MEDETTNIAFFEEKGEPKRNQKEVYQPNALGECRQEIENTTTNYE